MISRQTGRTVYALALVGLAVALVASAVRAQSPAFYAKRTDIQQQAAADRASAQLNGDANRKKLYTLYPTPEIRLAKAVTVAAGASAPISLVGTFSDKTTFVSAADGIELTNGVVAANSFKATVSAAAGLPPGWARIYAFAPVSGAETWTPAIFVGTPQAYTLTATNGWTIKLAPETPAFAFSKPGTATVTYKAQYFKAGATASFETMSGSLTIEAEDGPGSYTFMMSAGSSGSSMAEVLALGEKLGALMKAGKYDSPELPALQAKMEAAQERYAKEMEAQMKDPAAFQKKQDDFGCGSIYLSIRASAVTGNVNCGKNVGSSLAITGR